MHETTRAHASYHLDTTASAMTIWDFFKSVAEWKQWNAGVHSCTIDGPFAEGAWMTMVLPDREIIMSQLVEVAEPVFFTDETRLGDTTVRVKHSVSRVSNEYHRITYSIDVVGANADDICAGVSADFPEVLRALAAQAESREAK